MSNTTRRNFLRCSSAWGLSATAYARVARGAVESQRLSLGLIGCGGRMKSLHQGFAEKADISWVCDPDEARAGELRQKADASHVTHDLRKVLDDKSVDAVVIATPDHWHAPAAILACNAGKHVYVEKPCSHNFREGQLLVEAARRKQVVVQHGTQSRTNPLIVNAINLLRQGQIGDVLVAKAWNVQRRRNIGSAQPTSVPPGVDYDTWVGPAEFMPFQANRFHYDWHWWHNFGTGDIGNDGAHEIDIARWGLATQGLPSSAVAVGGKFYFDDDQQFPDTATCIFQWPGSGKPKAGGIGGNKQLIFEMRIWSKNYPYNCDTGIEFYGTQGMLFVSKRGKLQIWDDSNRLVDVPDFGEQPTTAQNHQEDFLDAIVNHRPPAAEIAVGHESCSLIHLANISVRTGRSLQINPDQQNIVDDPQASQLLSRTYRDGGHWAVPVS